jgi:uncharacterized protein (TIGR04141 family)
MAAQRTLTIYLLREGVTSHGAMLKPGTQHYPISVAGTRIGDLYVKPLQPRPPSWIDLFADAGIDLTSVQGMGTCAVLLITTGHRTFAVTFGSGRSLLQPDTTEDRFGLKATLNAVDPGKIQSVERLTVDSPTPHSQIQARIGVDIRQFGLNIDQDLLREVMGPPRNKALLGARLAGKDALHASGSFTLQQLPAFLRRYLTESRKDDYRDHFPWVDNIQEVKNTTFREELDDRLATALQRRALDNIWLAAPEIIDWSNVDAFTYRDTANAEHHADMDLSAFLDTIRDLTTLSISALKRYRICALDDEGNMAYDWSAYHCIYAELHRGKRLYLLNNGTWFEVESSFRQRIENAYDAVPARPRVLPPATEREKEEDYNDRVATSHNFALMDRQLIPFPDTRNTIEFCDLYTKPKELIHVKRYSGSSTLSHLFAQGVNSAQLFAGDPAFRKAVNKKLPSGYKLQRPADPLPPQTYAVTYAIIKKGTAPLSIPFFSKVSLTNAVTTLRALGYTPQLTKISITP